MKKNRAIQAKAIFLLIVFMTNTILGFACSVGLNTNLKRSHHHEAAIDKDPLPFQGMVAGHTATESDKSHTGQHHDHHSKEGKDKCCNDLVVKFEKIEKLGPQSFKIIVAPAFLIAALPFPDCFEVYSPYSLLPDRKNLVYYHSPPGRAIRIAIQSFQI